MKKLTALALLFMTVFTFSCSSDDDDNVTPPISDEIYIRAKVNGVQKNFIDPESITSLNTLIRGYSGNGNTFQALSLWMPNNVTVGSHAIAMSNGSDVTIYSASYNETFDLEAEGSTGQITVISITDDYITGTFSFTGEASDGTVYNVTEGEFRAYNSFTDF